jgi:hypothetical protein
MRVRIGAYEHQMFLLRLPVSASINSSNPQALPTPPLSATGVCKALGISRSRFYKYKDALTAAGVLVEALPRLGHARYLARPIQRYCEGASRSNRRAPIVPIGY